jgi:hypothetical protein
MQRCKEIVDKCSKSFIDLGADNGPNCDNDDMNVKEKAYRNIINNRKIFELDDVKIQPGKSNDFEKLGQMESKLTIYDSNMLNKIDSMFRHITVEIPDRYFIEELIINFDRN